MGRKKMQIRGPDLEAYITDENRRRFISYEEGAKLYRIRYWTFVHICQKAHAIIPMRNKTIVDLDVLEDFLEAYCGSQDEEGDEEMRRKKEKAPIDERMKKNGKKFVRIDEAAELYSVSERTIIKWNKQCKARYKIDGVVLYNTEKTDRYIETMGQEEDW